MPSVTADTDNQLGLRLAADSYEWFRRAANRDRWAYRIIDITILAVSAVIPLAAVFASHREVVPAVLGAIVVVASGLRTIFRWQENYLRFVTAREAIKQEQRKYLVGAEPYADPATREAELVEAVSRIENDEMNAWKKLAGDRKAAA
jgi:hypothetical protein